MLRNVLTEGRDVERAGHAQRATEGPPSLREVEAARSEVQGCASPGRATTGIGNEPETGRTVDHHDTQ